MFKCFSHIFNIVAAPLFPVWVSFPNSSLTNNGLWPTKAQCVTPRVGESYFEMRYNIALFP